MTSATSLTSDTLLIRFPAVSTIRRVSRDTISELAKKQLACASDSDVLRHAALRLADQVLPKYELDDGLLSDKQMAAIGEAAGVPTQGKVVSNLF